MLALVLARDDAMGPRVGGIEPYVQTKKEKVIPDTLSDRWRRTGERKCRKEKLPAGRPMTSDERKNTGVERGRESERGDTPTVLENTSQEVLLVSPRLEAMTAAAGELAWDNGTRLARYLHGGQ